MRKQEVKIVRIGPLVMGFRRREQSIDGWFEFGKAVDIALTRPVQRLLTWLIKRFPRLAG